jgi:hypothetical protein
MTFQKGNRRCVEQYSRHRPHYLPHGLIISYRAHSRLKPLTIEYDGCGLRNVLVRKGGHFMPRLVVDSAGIWEERARRTALLRIPTCERRVHELFACSRIAVRVVDRRILERCPS